MSQQVFIYNQDLTPSAQSAVAGLSVDAAIDSSSLGRQCFMRFDGELYAYSVANLSLYRLTSPASSGSIAGAAIPVVITPAAVNSSDELQGRLWMGTLASGNVYSWDGQYLGEDVTGLGSGPLIMAAYHEEILAFGTNYCKKRMLDGTWTTVTMPVGMTSFVPRAKAVYKDYLYVGGYDNGATYPGKILRYDGTTLTVANTVLVGNTEQEAAGVTAMTTFNGYLYYGYQQIGTARVCKIGKYNGSAWTDTEKDFAPTSDLIIGGLAEYRGSLAVGFSTGVLAASTLTNTSGTYTTLATEASLSGGIFDLIASI